MTGFGPVTSIRVCLWQALNHRWLNHDVCANRVCKSQQIRKASRRGGTVIRLARFNQGWTWVIRNLEESSGQHSLLLTVLCGRWSGTKTNLFTSLNQQEKVNDACRIRGMTKPNLASRVEHFLLSMSSAPMERISEGKGETRWVIGQLGPNRTVPTEVRSNISQSWLWVLLFQTLAFAVEQEPFLKTRWH